MQVNVYNLIQD